MKKKVALLAGGFTGEFVISMQSAEVIEKSIDINRYEVYKIAISKDGWYYVENGENRSNVDKNDFSIRCNDEKVTFDVVFIAIHGSPGEDGKLQGYFDMLNLPYTTCDAATSAITMNKTFTKASLSGVEGLSFSKSKQLFKNRRYDKEELKAMRFPLFVKPNNGGSSIGMSKINDAKDLPLALEKAFAEDEQVIVEEFIKGREVSVGAARLSGEIKVFPGTEIVTSKEFFDFEAKYTPGITQEITPARISEEEKEEIEKVVLAIYQKLNCKGGVRIDFIQEESSGKLFFIELNTVPGQSENSIMPQQIRASGMSMKEYYSLILEETLKNAE